MTNRPKTIKEVSILLRDNVDETCALGNFLDEMVLNFSTASISEVPVSVSRIQLAKLAGLAEMLAEKNAVSVPSWTLSDECFLEHEFFPPVCKSEKFREFLKHETPIWFKKRNIFISANAFDRV